MAVRSLILDIRLQQLQQRQVLLLKANDEDINSAELRLLQRVPSPGKESAAVDKRYLETPAVSQVSSFDEEPELEGLGAIPQVFNKNNFFSFLYRYRAVGNLYHNNINIEHLRKRRSSPSLYFYYNSTSIHYIRRRRRRIR